MFVERPGRRLKETLMDFVEDRPSLRSFFRERVLIIYFLDKFFEVLFIASGAWIFAAVAGLMFILPGLFFIPKEAEFAKMHEEAKQNKDTLINDRG